MQKIAPCLWFDGNAEEAAHFYTSVFADSRIATVMHYTDAGPGPEGKVLAITFEIEGQEFMALNGGPQFPFTPAISLFVHCSSQQEVDRYWTKLIEGGGSPWQCGWLKDRFGVDRPRRARRHAARPGQSESEPRDGGNDEDGQARCRATGASVSRRVSCTRVVHELARPRHRQL
jgi:predicted 3-demethylubiquinone-9 3-methyltransferase (glyoxalase superfamily)